MLPSRVQTMCRRSADYAQTMLKLDMTSLNSEYGQFLFVPPEVVPTEPMVVGSRFHPQPSNLPADETSLIHVLCTLATSGGKRTQQENRVENEHFPIQMEEGDHPLA